MPWWSNYWDLIEIYGHEFISVSSKVDSFAKGASATIVI